MSVVGFLIRWGSMGLGAVLLAGGVQGLVTFKARDEHAVARTPADVMALAGSPQDEFVTVDAPLDMKTRVWETLLPTPRFVRRDTGRVYPVVPGKDLDPQSLVGTSVSLNHALDSRRIECQIVREDPSGQTLMHMRVLSPVDGTDGGLWVLSPRVDQESEADVWQERGAYTGVAGRLADLSSIASELGYTFQQIGDFARTNLDLDIPNDAVLVIDGAGASPDPTGVASFAAVAGTDGGVIARWVGQPPEGAITGMIVPLEVSSWGAGPARAIGADAPDQCVVIDTTQTAAMANAHERLTTSTALIAGAALLAFGAGTTCLKHLLKAARRRAKESAAHLSVRVSPQQAIALGIPIPGAPAPHQLNPCQTPRPVGGSGQATTRAVLSTGAAPLSAEDAALEAEMARWTSGNARSQAA